MTGMTSPASSAGRGVLIMVALGVLLLLLLSVAANQLAPRGRAPALPARHEPDPVITRSLDQLAAITADMQADERRLLALRNSPDAAARKAEIKALEGLVNARRESAAQVWQDLGALMEIPTPDRDRQGLVRFPSQPVERHNYSQIYHPIEGPQPYKMPDGFSFRFDHVLPQADGSLVHRVDARAGGAIKWERELSRARKEAHYTVEATINQIHPGIVYAPLWLFSEGSSEEGHEYDFEIMQGRIEYNLHNGRGGFNMRKVEKDIAGHRMRYEIIRRPGEVTMRVESLTDGWRDEMVVTPARVAEWARQEGAPEDLRFPPDDVAMFPVTELWRCRWPEWCGEWTAPPAGKAIEMVVHGYRVDP